MKPINYKLPIAKTFPAHHPRKGQETGFWDKIDNALSGFPDYIYPNKLHTIRSNYEKWEKRFNKIEAGEAVLTLYEWSGKPYKSKHRHLVTLDRDDYIGLQKLIIESYEEDILCTHTGEFIGLKDPEFITDIREEENNRTFEIDSKILAKNDGLNYADFINWFNLKAGKKYEPFALIHFTKFRY